MRHTKKILSFIIIFTMLSGVLVFATPADIEGSAYEEAISSLIALDLLSGYEDGTFQPDNTVTRAEIITRMLGLSELNGITFNDTPFTDVPDGHWAVSNISAAYSMGIINGHGNNTFDPDGIVTYEQAVKMIVSALGYDRLAQLQGGYPMGYLLIAAQNDITVNVSAAYGEGAKRGLIAQLIYNSLEVDLMQITSYGDTNRREVLPGQNVLTEYLHLEKGKGIVSGNSNTLLIGPSNLADDEVQIAGKTYKTGQTNADELLGYSVTFYVESNDQLDKNTLVLVVPEKRKNATLTISADDLLTDESKFSATNIVYTDEYDKKQNAIISDIADIIYNGVANDSFVLEDLKVENGEILLLDNDGDEEYDVVFITSYEHVIVESINVLDETIYDMYDSAKKIEFDSDSKDYKITITRNGKNAQLSELRKWDVISLARSKNTSGKQIIDIAASGIKIKGQASEFYEDTLIINDQEYKMTKELVERLASDNNPVLVGEEVTYYIDVNGKIAAIDLSGGRNRFAYLIATDKGKGLDPSIQVKVFDSRGSITILAGDSSTRLNGIKVRDLENEYDGFVQQLMATGRESGKIGQLIVYEQDSDGKLTDIHTVKQQSSETDDLRLDVSKRTLHYKTTTRTFLGLVNIDDGTSIFAIPEDETDERSYKMLNRSDFANDESLTIEAYNLSDVNLAEAIIVFGKAGGTDIDTKITPAVVDRVTRTINDEGMIVNKLNAFKDGKPVELYTIDEVDISNLKKGDVVRYSVNGANEINELDVLFRFDESNPAELRNVNSDNYIYVDRHIYGRVDLRDGDYMNVTLKTTTGEEKIETIGLQGAYFYLYNVPAKNISVISAKDISKGDTFFMRQRYGDTKEVIIYKFD